MFVGQNMKQWLCVMSAILVLMVLSSLALGVVLPLQASLGLTTIAVYWGLFLLLSISRYVLNSSFWFLLSLSLLFTGVLDLLALLEQLSMVRDAALHHDSVPYIQTGYSPFAHAVYAVGLWFAASTLNGGVVSRRFIVGAFGSFAVFLLIGLVDVFFQPVLPILSSVSGGRTVLVLLWSCLLSAVLVRAGWLVSRYGDTSLGAQLRRLFLLAIAFACAGEFFYIVFPYFLDIRSVAVDVGMGVDILGRLCQGLSAFVLCGCVAEAVNIGVSRDSSEKSDNTVWLSWDGAGHKQSAKTLDESRRALQGLVRNLPGIVFRCVYDHDWTMQYLSEGVEKITGYPAEMLLGNSVLSFNDVIHPDDRAPVWDAVQEAVSARKNYEIEYRIVRRDGAVRYLREWGAGILQDNGDVASIEGFISDITEQQEGAQELRRLASAINQVAEIVLITDASGLILYTNPAFEQVTGYRREEVLGKTPALLKSDHHDQTFFSRLRQELKQGRIWRGRFVNRKKDGSLFTAEGTISPVVSEDGQITNFVSVTRDISVELEQEQRIQVAQKNEILGALAGGIAHDINNILTPIIGYSEMLREDFSPDSFQQYSVREILKATGRAKELVAQILAFSRQSESRSEKIMVAGLVDEVAKLLEATLPSSIRLKRDLERDCGPVFGDASQLHQVLMNLMTNAFHAIGEAKGCIRVRLHRCNPEVELLDRLGLKQGWYAALKVEDDGHGIAPEAMAKLFDSSYTTKPKGKGTGLGLSVVKRVVERFSGAVDVASTPGLGSCFTVYLPLYDHDEAVVERLGLERLPQIAGGNERILIVDDELPIVLMLKQLLERDGYKVVGMTSSLDALTVFAAECDAFDLVITDMTMPEMNGLELAAEMLKIRPDLPVLLCTGFSESVDENEAKARGLAGFIFKPIVKTELFVLLRRILDRTKT